MIHWDWRLVAAIAFLVVAGSILAVNALHTLMRHGHAARVTSLLYLTPVVAVFLEWIIFGMVPSRSPSSHRRHVCRVALVTWQRRTPVPDVET